MSTPQPSLSPTIGAQAQPLVSPRAMTSTLSPTSGTHTPNGRPKSVLIPGSNINTLKMKALFEGGGGGAGGLSPLSPPSASNPASTHSFPSVATLGSSSLGSSKPARPVSAWGASPVSSTATFASTNTNVPAPVVAAAAPVTRIKSFFEDKAQGKAVTAPAVWSGSDQLKKRQEDRVMKDRIEHEFFETEENYYKSLDIVVEMYIRPMREAKIISQQDMDTIFSNIETIHQIHKNLVQDLRPLFSPPEPPAPGEQPQTSTIPTIRANKKTQKSLGDLLRAFIPFFKMYTIYINSFDNANKRVTELQNSSKKFSQFLNDCKERPECKKLDLVSYLIMPIQRLPRYELLLRDILRHTSDAGEHAKIEQVFNTVAEVNKHVNSEKGASILRARLYKLKAAVKHRVDIFSRPDRRLVREGDMGVRKVMRSIETPVIRKGDKHQSAEKRGTMVIETFLAKKEFKTQYFFLFDDFLLQVVKKSKNDKYAFRAMYNLLHISALPVQQGVPTTASVPSTWDHTHSFSTPANQPSYSSTNSCPTRSVSLKIVKPPNLMNEINLLSDQDKEQALNQGGPDEKTGTDAASDNEGEVVDEPDADLMLLLVDHKTNERIHLKFKSPHEKEDWIELIQKGKEDMIKQGLEGPKDLKEEAIAEKKAKEEKEKEERELKKSQQEKAKTLQKEGNMLYKYDHMFKGIVLPALSQENMDEICGPLIDMLADKADISEFGTKIPFRLRTVRTRNLVVKFQLWPQKPNNIPTGVQESVLRDRSLHSLIVAYDSTREQSLQIANGWMSEIRKINPTIVGALLAFQPQPDGSYSPATTDQGRSVADKHNFLFFKVHSAAYEEPYDQSFATMVERVIDTKESQPISPSVGGVQSDDNRAKMFELDLGTVSESKRDGKLKGIFSRKKKLGRSKKESRG